MNHNGYQRHILHENPLRYDDDGDPLDDLDEDEEDIDASPNEENPFGETRLECKTSAQATPSATKS